MVLAFQAGQATPLVRRPVRPLAPHVRRTLAARRPSRAERPLPGPGRCARRVVDKRRDRTGRDIVTVPRVHRRAANDPRQATAWQFGRGEIGRVNEHLTRPYVNGPSLDLTDDVTSGWVFGTISATGSSVPRDFPPFFKRWRTFGHRRFSSKNPRASTGRPIARQRYETDDESCPVGLS